jgi:hypothetical protein
MTTQRTEEAERLLSGACGSMTCSHWCLCRICMETEGHYAGGNAKQPLHTVTDSTIRDSTAQSPPAAAWTLLELPAPRLRCTPGTVGRARMPQCACRCPASQCTCSGQQDGGRAALTHESKDPAKHHRSLLLVLRQPCRLRARFYTARTQQNRLQRFRIGEHTRKVLRTTPQMNPSTTLTSCSC